MSSAFKEMLEIGKVGESQIANWLRAHKCSVLPVYDVLEGRNKAPVLKCSDNEVLIAPDMMVFGDDGQVLFVEAKHKESFSWHRNTGKWTTGIDLRNYRHYLKVIQATKKPVWLFFLHRGGNDKDTKEKSPSGLYAGNLENLQYCENHRSHYDYGMVYWSIDSLTKLSDYPFCVDEQHK